MGYALNHTSIRRMEAKEEPAGGLRGAVKMGEGPHEGGVLKDTWQQLFKKEEVISCICKTVEV